MSLNLVARQRKDSSSLLILWSWLLWGPMTVHCLQIGSSQLSQKNWKGRLWWTHCERSTPTPSPAPTYCRILSTFSVFGSFLVFDDLDAFSSADPFEWVLPLPLPLFSFRSIELAVFDALSSSVFLDFSFFSFGDFNPLESYFANFIFLLWFKLIIWNLLIIFFNFINSITDFCILNFRSN